MVEPLSEAYMYNNVKAQPFSSTVYFSLNYGAFLLSSFFLSTYSLLKVGCLTLLYFMLYKSGLKRKTRIYSLSNEGDPV
ncbi:hypothetical protein AYI68_g803 [Smittium mucronatum]|uniref:Uncharacterized protein n=1 Tax=Smittium mucronatum TaxID=133383 RepID=A0A1R0H759_9FUNG|nr:hypothetical protein AYI68_g803 [Smittium mucronatum]